MRKFVLLIFVLVVAFGFVSAEGFAPSRTDRRGQDSLGQPSHERAENYHRSQQRRETRRELHGVLQRVEGSHLVSRAVAAVELFERQPGGYIRLLRA